MTARSALLGLWLLGGCATVDQTAAGVYTPSQVLAATKDLEGREIAVRGWIGGCRADENRICGLYTNRRSAVGPRPSEWPLPIVFNEANTPRIVRQVVARGTYVVTCRNTETTICVEYDGHFQIHSIED